MEILTGWKDIATYLRMGVRTVQRHESQLSLPIRRPAGKGIGPVIAIRAELDAWVNASPVRGAFQVSRAAVDNAVFMNEFRRQLEEFRRLRQESAELREEHQRAVELLRESVRLCAAQQDPILTAHC